MKRLLLIGLILILSFSIFGLSITEENLRLIDISTNHTANNVRLRVSNYGVIGSGSARPQWPSLEYPAFSETTYLYHGALWVGAKKIRRDMEGLEYYWRNWPPVNQNDVILETDSLFDPDLHTIVVVDTLSSVGFDGDYAHYELLPAYNPFEANYIGDQYEIYNPLDVVMRSILGIPSFNDADFPHDPAGIFDFFTPLPEPGNFPGIETLTSFYYDHSPFTPWGDPRHRDRKYGVSASVFEHYPLYVSIRQRSFAWAYEDLYDMIFFSFDIYNTGDIDTLYDVALAYYMDTDVGPQEWDGDAISMNDISGYYAGEGYEFAYSRDSDPDSQTPYWVAFKLFPVQDTNFAAWSWTRGDGPDDRRPIRIPPLSGLITSNEKYWLQTGRNPNFDKFEPLRPLNWMPGMDPHYEQPEPNDTRFLYTIYGDMFGFDDPTSYSINLAPGENIALHGVLFLGEDLDDLKIKSLLAEDLYDSGYDTSPYDGVPFIPFITSAEVDGLSLIVKWVIDEGADTQYLYYKHIDDPDTAWEIIELDPTINSYLIDDLELNQTYNIMVATLYDDLLLESVTWKVKITPSFVDGDEIIPHSGTRLIGNYPNPFNPDTRILFYLDQPTDVKVEVFNIKGQLVTTLTDQRFDQGYHTLFWNGKDAINQNVASGVYLYRLVTSDSQYARKMLMLK